MELIKIYDFFQPEKVQRRIHIIGCGSVGSTIAENLARCGIEKMTLWDEDKVESKNLVNQMFYENQIGMNKAEAVKENLEKIDSNRTTTIKTKKNWKGEELSGYVFLCVDSIETRKAVVEKIKIQKEAKAIFDVRTELKGAQLYAAKTNDNKQIENLCKSMEFNDKDVSEDEITACGTILGVATTIRIAAALTVNNFINLLNTGELQQAILFNGFDMKIATL